MNNRFYNPGMLGDIIYAIPFCLSCAGIFNENQLDNGNKFDYYLDTCLLHKENGFDSLKMLGDVLMLQPYIGELHIDKQSPWVGANALDLGIIRKGRVNMNNGDITRRYRFLRRLPEYFDASGKWLRVDGYENSKYDWIEGKIGVFRTTRYRNRKIANYNALKPFMNRLLFFGTESEHLMFCSEMGGTIMRFQGDFIDVCRAFQRCLFVVGNQTFLFALAEALKVPRLCEMASSIPDVMPLGCLANCFVDNEDFHQCIEMYRSVLKF